MNFDRFDGIIVAGITLAVQNLPERIEEMLISKCKCPVVYIDYTSRRYPYVFTNDRKAMEQLVDHQIDCHGFRDIFCLAADPESNSTFNRVAAYKASLKKHNIAINEDRISYDGDFYYTGGERLAKKILSGEIEKPEAVVCISDRMAIGLVNELTKHGIRIPEDIAVTGYDASDDAAIGYTVITTYSPPIKQAGAEAVCELTRLMTGKRPIPISIDSGGLEIGSSCGCHDMHYMNRSSILRLKRNAEDNKVLLDSYMMESLTAVTDFEDCIEKFCYYLYLIKDYSDYFLCLCDNWDGSDNGFNTEKECKSNNGYSDRMKLVLANENSKFVSSNFYFNTKDMLPDLWKDRDKPKAYYFTPLHFNENTIGYSVLSYGDKVKVFDINYRSWSRNIMNVLEFNRIHRMLYRASFRDVLTGIYNRRGFDQKLPNITNEVINQDRKLVVVMADLDNLKEINDGYGHQEGDNVITVVANAIQGCNVGNKICARVGGDEFLIVGADDQYNSLADHIIASVNHQINQYNLKSNKPYKIHISMGAFSDYINDEKEVNKLIGLADHEMYINKKLNKKGRIRGLAGRFK
jgi:diguanylate cyclase (GGDEF)-like protein